MLLSRKWLSEFVAVPEISDRDFAEAMTLSGSKVESTEMLSEKIKNVVAGRVTEIWRHENSDHMWVCLVDIGEAEPVQIVTGAQNVKQGDIVPVAKHKSLLPCGKAIERGKLRGVVSNGMLCSLSELGLTLHDYPDAIEDGIWIITNPNVRPGDDIGALIGLDDKVVEFEITPNRPDCLSVIGLAREAAVTFDRPLREHTPVIKGSGGDITDLASIEIADAALCPRYTARMVRNVKIQPSPEWMRERLRNSGVRPINNIVDITNYVMLEYGQPMHAFDFSCVDGGHIIVRTAREGEVIQTLDGNDRLLTTDMLCICDEHKPVCVAGVMGGANSEIVGDTAMVLFESANFNGVSVRRTATALGMRTDASSRYEKGLDPANTLKAVQRACELVEQLGCGEVIDGIIDIVPEPFPAVSLELEPQKINALLGTDIAEEEMRSILQKLGFTLSGSTVSVPSWRSDVEHYSDIAEEVARFHGYNNIPTTLLSGDTTCGGYSEAQQTENRLGELCRALGYDEIITYSFISPACFDKISLPADSPLRGTLKILNPLGEDTSVMRTTILPSMLEILSRNFAYRNKDVRLYELGRIYLPKADGLADEPKILALGAYGGGADFYSLKGAVEEILRALCISGAVFTADTENPSYHPGRCAAITLGGETLGVIGQIHPTVAAAYGMDCEVYCAELSFDVLFNAADAVPVYTPLQRYPAVTRDIAVVCNSSVTVGRLAEVITAAGGKYLRECRFFDVYTGAPIRPGCKSVAFKLTLLSDEKTLTVAEADEAVSAILAALHEQCEAVIR